MPYFPIIGDTLTMLLSKPYSGTAAPEQGFYIMNRDGVWVIDLPDESGMAAFSAWLSAFDDIGWSRREAKKRLTEEHERRANAAEVQGIQIGLLTEAVRLLAINSGTAFNSWGAVARNRMNAIRARLLRIEQINTAAELISADIDAMTDSYAISQFDVAASPRWPVI